MAIVTIKTPNNIPIDLDAEFLYGFFMEQGHAAVKCLEFTKATVDVVVRKKDSSDLAASKES